jgi:hypothetical protein
MSKQRILINICLGQFNEMAVVGEEDDLRFLR